MHLATVPNIIKPLAGQFTWHIPGCTDNVFITFDDGPTPDVTPAVLDILDSHQAKATFFCLGKNVKQHPELFQEVIDRGHAVGNHTYSHPNGWKTPKTAYLREVIACRKLVDSRLFRPPYGRIHRDQAAALRPHFHLIMWDVLSGDYLPNRSPERCLRALKKHTKPGSIIVFHDSQKAANTMLNTLPAYLQWLTEQGWRSAAIDAEQLTTKNTFFS